MKNRSRMVISSAHGGLVSFDVKVSGECHGKPGGDENADTNYILAAGPAELSVRVDDKAVQHQPSACSDNEARKRAAPPANDADDYCHDGELSTPVDALACAGDRHSDAQSYAERHDADECVGQARVRWAEGPTMDNDGASPAVRQRQHRVLLSDRCRRRQRI
jgi:hypothetical protein